MYLCDKNLWGRSESFLKSKKIKDQKDTSLSAVEKLFLLQAERGDCATVLRIIEQYSQNTEEFNINCVDCLDRSALIMAIENENIELVKLLLEHKIDVKDALLHAIKEEFVEAVEILLDWKSGQSQQPSSTFTPDITPLVLAAHKNNYEIIKILLERGATLPAPHDVKCGCDQCVSSAQTDSLRHSQARINAYKALTSPSLISLSSTDPLLTAFELSWDLRRLSRTETEFRADYKEMRHKVENFATALLDHVRTSEELMVLLNFDHQNPKWFSGDRQTLERLKLAIKYKQKRFVAHPNVQQLLAAIWYEGVPGFRRKNIFWQSVEVIKFALMFPVFCTIYMVAPKSKIALFMKRPFVKFICHSSSYIFFLILLGASSQKFEIVILEWFGANRIVEDWKKRERGRNLNFIEYGVLIYVLSLMWDEIRSLWCNGLRAYIHDLWNVVDFVMFFFYILWFALRMSSLYITWRVEAEGGNPWSPREDWNAFEPMLISEGAFAAGMIVSFLKLVHIFSVNPHLGPLQISLGRMIIDIAKFFFIYTLVLFAFGCGLNQMLWYYAALEKNKCFHLPGGLPDFETNDKACSTWRRYANLFETSQSLFWASFGLVDLISFELTGIKSFTRFWALLIFGSYSVINIIVLLNMLIAMMANSYQLISEHADTEWKFARSKLWISYFEDEDVLPPPFNILPNMQTVYKKFNRRSPSLEQKSKNRAQGKHDFVVKSVIRRYVTGEQRKRSEFGITEDDVIEIRQDISSLRYELIDILSENGMKTPNTTFEDKKLSGKKGKIIERRILRNFSIGTVEGIIDEFKRFQAKEVGGTIFNHIVTQLRCKSNFKRNKRRNWSSFVKSVAPAESIASLQGQENTKIIEDKVLESTSVCNLSGSISKDSTEIKTFENEIRRCKLDRISTAAETEWF